MLLFPKAMEQIRRRIILLHWCVLQGPEITGFCIIKKMWKRSIKLKRTACHCGGLNMFKQLLKQARYNEYLILFLSGLLFLLTVYFIFKLYNREAYRILKQIQSLLPNGIIQFMSSISFSSQSHCERIRNMYLKKPPTFPFWTIITKEGQDSP